MANIKTVLSKILILTLAVLMTFSATACDNGSSVEKAGRNDVKIWTIGTNEKVILEDAEYYEDRFGTCEINLVVGKNEYEHATVVISAPNKKITEYDVTVTDLTNANGDTYSKENVAVYSNLYYTVSASNEYYTKAGSYPDALLPFETTVEYKENYVDKDTNQSVYFEYYIPEDQTAGTFTGSIKITCDGNDFYVPVTLRVYDFGISEESHIRSSYNLSWAMPNGEMDNSIEGRLKYLDYLTEHRVSGLYIFTEHPSSEEGIEEWLDIAAELCENPKFTDLSFEVPRKTYDSVIINGYEYNGYKLPDHEYIAEWFYRIAERCLEDETGELDILKRLLFKGTDEPELWGTSWDFIRCYHYMYIKGKELAKTLCEPLRTAENAEHFDKLMESIDNIPVVITAQTRYPTSTTVDPSRIDGIDFCPYFSRVSSEADRELFKSMSDHGLWAYGCNTPDSPYPNYHIPDALMSARIFGWMAFEYGLVGDLYWAVDSWGDEPDYDYYSGKKATDPGEGVLVYPGKPYGLDQPIGSTRLKAIRDGREEYEVMYLLEQAYKAKNENYSFIPFVSILSDYLYDQMKCSYDFESFDKSRTALYQLMELASSKAGVRIVDIEESNGLYSFTVYANDGYTPKNAGVALTPIRDVVGADGVNGKEYLLQIQLGNGVTGVDLSVDVDGYTSSFSWYLGKAAVNYGAEQFNLTDFKGGSMTKFTATYVDANTVVADRPAGEKWIHMYYYDTKEGGHRDVNVTNRIFDQVGLNTKKIVFTVYNANDFDVMFNVRCRYTEGKVDVTLKSNTLKPGMNNIVLDNVFSLNWRDNGKIKLLYFTTGIYSRSDPQIFEPLDKLYFVSFSVYDI